MLLSHDLFKGKNKSECLSTHGRDSPFKLSGFDNRKLTQLQIRQCKDTA